MKMVRYNGLSDAYYPCDSAKDLVKGQVYEVSYEHDLGWQTNYVLRGIHGEFNSAWFDLVRDTKENAGENLPKVCLAVAREVPVVGQRFDCNCIEYNCGQTNFSAVRTSTVVCVKQLGEIVWAARTRSGSVYIATIG